MRAAVTSLIIAAAFTLISGASSGGEDSTLILEGVIVTENPAHSIALIRRDGASRARPLRIGQEYSGYVLLAVTKTSATLQGGNGAVRLYLTTPAGLSESSQSELENDEASDWIQRDFPRSSTRARLEKEIPVILSDTELTPRVEEGQVRGLELLRLPDGTVLSETGLLPGDVLRSINDEPLRGLDSLWKILARHQNDAKLRVVVERRGEILRLAYAFTN